MLGRMPETRSKILVTIGPSSRAPETIAAMVAAGADGFRINASHGNADEWRADAHAVREAAVAAGRPLSLVFDLCGPKLRLSPDAPERSFAPGDTARFGPEDGAIPVASPSFAEAVIPGRSELVIGDGTPRFATLSVDDATVSARCIRSGRIAPGKGLFVTSAEAVGGALTEKDYRDLDVACELEADWVAQSFVRTADDVVALRAELAQRGSTARVIAKIEKLEAVENLTAILEVCDGVMVARGDLGVEAGVAQVPLLQKEIIRKAIQAGRLAVTATQMLESMIHAPEPTRAEASDIANAVLDGTSALMLSGETAIGEHPVQAVGWMTEIAHSAQRAAPFALELTSGVRGNSEAVIRSAAHLAQQLNAAALVIPTTTGGSARAAARCRTPRPIIAVTRDPRVANQLALEWGVLPGILSPHAGRLEELIDQTVEAACKIGRLRDGDGVVVTYGQSERVSGGTDLIAVRVVGASTANLFEHDPALFDSDPVSRLR